MNSLNEKKIVTIVGARPQFIKLSPVSRQMPLYGLQEVVVHTGQHYDDSMSKVFFEELCIREPQYNLEVGSANHGAQTAKMLQGIEEILLKEKPNMLLVYGDTNSTLAGAVAASKLHIPIAHVEAGLRSFDKRMPEEINRLLTDHVSDLLFTPTEKATQQLLLEGMDKNKIHQVGDVMYDAMLLSQEHPQETSILDKLNVQSKEYILVTIHRQSNTDDMHTLSVIIQALNKLSEEYKIVFPAHPRTRKAMESKGLLSALHPSILFIEPVGYLDMVKLETHARLVMTDSGGVQKEAFFCETPCLTLRAETEWVELVDLGWNSVLFPQNSEEIYLQAKAMVNAPKRGHYFPYGDGNAAGKICEKIAAYIENTLCVA